MTQDKNFQLNNHKVLIAATGSIAAVKTPILVSMLISSGAEVKCMISESASQIVSPVSLATLSRNHCYQDSDQWLRSQAKPLHIELSEWADVIVIAPLSATTLSKFVYGSGEGLIASTLLAFKGPVIAAAAMNTHMWENISVKENWEKLERNENVSRLSPASGLLACDQIGQGRMVNPELICLAIESSLIHYEKCNKLEKDFSGKRFLISAGPTIEGIDPVRFISNRSSGIMGIAIAQAAKFRGANIDFVHGPMEVSPAFLEGLNTYPIKNSKDLEFELNNLQSSADFVVMAAAVTDMKKEHGEGRQKISKDKLPGVFAKDLVEVPDILKKMVSRKNSNQVFLGFAAVSGSKKDYESLGEQKRIIKGCDFLMANPIDVVGQGFGTNFNEGSLFGPNGLKHRFPTTRKIHLAHQILDVIVKFKGKLSKDY
tara:strand:- start:178 stop:1464 length:1287 start_codon:yes stop_codon:yes gene_type:complete